MDPATSTRTVLDAAKAVGLDDCGVATALPVPVDGARYDEYLARGMNSDMTYLADTKSVRFDPSKLLPDVKTVIVGLMAYNSELSGLEHRPPGRAFISRYAWGADYHRVVRDRLDALVKLIQTVLPGRYMVFVDTGPVFEKAYAQRAGLGFIGKNTLLIHPVYGSFVFLGVILTDQPMDPTPGKTTHACGNCTKCLDACPVDALQPYGLDATRCIGHINNMFRGPLPEIDFQGNLFGCDICQDVCPYNRKAARKKDSPFLPETEFHRYPDPEMLQSMSNREIRRFFRNTPVGFQKPRRLKEIAGITGRLSVPKTRR